jgi:VanZ family protein
MTEEEQLKPSGRVSTTSVFKSRLWRYGPLVVWAALIFIGSGNVLSAEHTSILLPIVKWLFPSLSQESLNTLHFLIRKTGHLTEYAILGMLAAYAFRRSTHQLLRRHWFWFSLLLAVIYALTDEYHQSFVPSRTASVYDSMIDSTGALIALMIIWLRHRRNDRHTRVGTGTASDRVKLQPAKS